MDDIILHFIGDKDGYKYPFPDAESRDWGLDHILEATGGQRDDYTTGAIAISEYEVLTDIRHHTSGLIGRR